MNGSIFRFVMKAFALVLYAAVTGLMAAFLAWSFVEFIKSGRFPTGRADDDAVRPVALHTIVQWSLAKRPDAKALGGYELDVHEEPLVIDTDKEKTPWERIVLMRLVNKEPTAAILPIIESIHDTQEKAHVLKTLAVSLRNGTLPPIPIGCRLPATRRLMIFSASRLQSFRVAFSRPPRYLRTSLQLQQNRPCRPMRNEPRKPYGVGRLNQSEPPPSARSMPSIPRLTNWRPMLTSRICIWR
jgi:hypothetical protein